MVQAGVLYQNQENNIPYKILYATLAYYILPSGCDMSI